MLFTVSTVGDSENNCSVPFRNPASLAALVKVNVVGLAFPFSTCVTIASHLNNFEDEATSCDISVQLTFRRSSNCLIVRVMP